MKPIVWLARTREALRGFPRKVKRDFGLALMAVQAGETPTAKPLKGFGGAGFLEIVEHFDGNSYRAVYTVKFAGVVYVLHVLHKKAKRKIATPRKEMDLVKRRLRDAESHYGRSYGSNKR